MKFNWKHLWAEALVGAGWLYFFLTPSLQTYMSMHPGTRTATIIAMILGLGFKKSPILLGN